MMIIHALLEKTWKKTKEKTYYGEDSIKTEGFIHASDVQNFHKVAPNFANVTEPMVLLYIDPKKVEPTIKWEDLDNCGTQYPHIYGSLNLDSVVSVVPYVKDEKGNWVGDTYGC